MSAATSISEYIVERSIKRLVHFSPRRNLIGMFRLGGIWPRAQLIEYANANADQDLMAYVTWNDSVRLDNRQDCINLSIERINPYLFPVFQRKFEERFHDDEPWCIIEIDPSVMMFEGVVFTIANAASGFVKRVGTATGLLGLKALYADKISVEKGYRVQVDVRTPDMCSAFPTSPQAEVMVPAVIPLDKIIGIVFPGEEDLLQVKAMLSIQFPEVKLPPMRVCEEDFAVGLQSK